MRSTVAAIVVVCVAAAVGLYARSAAPTRVSVPEAPEAPAVALTDWMESLGGSLPEAELTAKALDLMRATRSGGWQVRQVREEWAHRYPGRWGLDSGPRVIGRIERWDDSGPTPVSDPVGAIGRVCNDPDELALGLLSNIPGPGNTADCAMDALAELHDVRALPHLHVARDILRVELPGDGGPTKRLVAKLDRLIAELERESARK